MPRSRNLKYSELNSQRNLAHTGTLTTTSILDLQGRLTTDNGLIYNGAQLIIPQSMQAEMLLKTHANHFGPESNARMAREVQVLARDETNNHVQRL